MKKVVILALVLLAGCSSGPKRSDGNAAGAALTSQPATIDQEFRAAAGRMVGLNEMQRTRLEQGLPIMPHEYASRRRAILLTWRGLLSVQGRDEYARRCLELADGLSSGRLPRSHALQADPNNRESLNAPWDDVFRWYYEVAFNIAESPALRDRGGGGYLWETQKEIESAYAESMRLYLELQSKGQWKGSPPERPALHGPRRWDANQ